MTRLLRRAALAAVALTAATTFALPAAAALAQSDGDVTWMVRPSDGVGEDGRSWVELELDPGDTVTEHLLVRNLSTAPVTFVLSAADGYFTDTGRFNMLTSDQPSVDAGTWIDIQESVDVPSGGDVIVPFTLTVPDNATPGDHAAGVAAAIRSGGDDQVGIESRVGFRVMTRVTGELAPAVAATVSGEYSGTWNPFAPGRLDIGYVVENTGNTRLAVTPAVTVQALFGLVSFRAEGDPVAEMAPGESRSATVDIPAAWPLFAWSASVEADATTVGGGDAPASDPSADASSVVVAMPWPQLIVLALALLFGWLLWGNRRRRERLVAERIEQAREEGRTAAAATAPRAPAVFTLAVVLLAAGFVTAGDARAIADTVDTGGVVITVEIDDPTPTPTPAGSPITLPSTGGADPFALAAAGLGATALGVAVYLLRPKRRRTLADDA